MAGGFLESLRLALHAAAIVIVTALAGCSGQPTPGPGSMQGSDLLWPPGPGLPPLPVDPVLRTYTLQDCRSMGAGFEVPAVFARDWVPPGFEPFVLVPGTIDVFFTVEDCGRATFGRSVIEGFRRVQFSLTADPLNESWLPELVPSRFILDTFVSSEEAATWLHGLGVAASTAEIHVTTRTIGETRVHEWVISDEGESITFSYPDHGESSTPQRSLVNFYFAGPDPYIRVKEQMWQRSTFNGNTGGAVFLNGLGNVSAAARLGSYAFDGNPSSFEETSAQVELVFLTPGGSE